MAKASSRAGPTTPSHNQDSCYYGGQVYSPGSVVKMPDGTYMYCLNGSWRKK